MAISTLPPSPNGEISHNQVREKLNETITGHNNTTQGVVDNYVLASYGSIGVDATEPMTTINSTPQIITGFDTELATPKNIVYDLVGNGIKFDYPGAYVIMVKMALEFDEVNSGRRLSLTTYNATKATYSNNEFKYYVGRNSGGKDIVLPAVFQLGDIDVGDKFQLAILSENDTFTNVSNQGTVWGVASVSQALFPL